MIKARGDVDYLRRRYFDNVAVADLSVSLHTRQRHIEVILGLFRYRLCALEEQAMLEGHARHAVRISSRPVYVLRELVDLLRRERVVLPGYTYLQDLVREALAFERKRLAGALEGCCFTSPPALRILVGPETPTRSVASASLYGHGRKNIRKPAYGGS